MFAALFCTLAAKFFHALRNDIVGEYLSWILADIDVLLGIEVILALVCFRWRRKWVFRAASVAAAIICTWSVMNAGYLIRTGRQILPSTIAPLFRDPVNTLALIGVNLVKMPLAAILLLGPSAVALAFFFSVLARPPRPSYNLKLFANRIAVCVIIVFAAAVGRVVMAGRGSTQAASEGLRHNCHLKAVTNFLAPRKGQVTRRDLANAQRRIPYFDEIRIERSADKKAVNHNVVIVVLEGIQYRCTSLYNRNRTLTPYLAWLAEHGVEFANTRSSLAHTTKALFAILTGRFPSTSHDIVEAVPARKSYGSLVTILKNKLHFRTAFFQSAKGSFESRPALVSNLGFEKFWARDDLGDPNAFLGYLACDEFAVLEPIAEWIKAEQRPFFLTVLCSVTHDPYEIPEWFEAEAAKRWPTPPKEKFEHYLRAIYYTDKFIAALDARLSELGLKDETIVCIIGDHGEAFGEHGMLGHERIGFDEVFKVPWVIQCPSLVEAGRQVTRPVSSVDVTPTLLGLLGFETSGAGFDGMNSLRELPDDRKVFFCDWKHEGPAGFVKGTHKYTYNPTNETVSAYDLSADPLESTRIELPEQEALEIAEDIIGWRKSHILNLSHERTGDRMLFGRWLCEWRNRGCKAEYSPQIMN
jgi:glucan phosphoethanolaminetransferase (alkaline phosphatase superfamily)